MILSEQIRQLYSQQSAGKPLDVPHNSAHHYENDDYTSSTECRTNASHPDPSASS